VSEGGLEPRPWCCITGTVIYHQAKVTRRKPAGPAFGGQGDGRAGQSQRPGPRGLRKRRAVSRGWGHGWAGPRRRRRQDAYLSGNQAGTSAECFTVLFLHVRILRMPRVRWSSALPEQ